MAGSAHLLLGLPDARWLAPALQLNLDHGAYVDPSWLDALPAGALARRLLDGGRGQRRLSAYLGEALALDGAYCTDFSDPRARLVLLPGGLLRQLCLYIGLASHSDLLRKELDGARVRALRQAVGDHAYDFAIKRAPLLGRLPAAGPLADSVEPRLYALDGAAALAGWLAGADADLAGVLGRRFALKLPMPWRQAIERATRPAADDVPAWSPILRKLLHEIAPEWSPLLG